MSLNVVFMGTPDFAVPCLLRLLEDGHRVSGVMTQPDKPKGRSFALTPPPVKELAASRGLPVYQPVKLKDGEALARLKQWAPDVIVVVAYGRILPLEILSLPRLGCINVHASLLPKYRGAGPIQWSVIKGEAVTGVTTMYMDVGLDTGDMILKRETPIGPDETAGELHGRLMALGADCLIETLSLLEAGNAPRIPQADSESTYAPMLTKELARVDFSLPASEVHNLVRGLYPWPVAYTQAGEKRLLIHKTRLLPELSGRSGELLESENRFVAACGQGAVELVTVQVQGKKAMPGADCARGLRLSPGTILG